MILSDKTIKERIKTGEIVIEPFSQEFLQPASYDLHLDDQVLIFDKEKYGLIDVKKPSDALMKRIKIKEEGYLIHPGDFVLANIKEITGVDDRHVGRLEGKSSLGRLGLVIHVTAGFLDPGNKLRMTLEMVNLSGLPIRIYRGMKIAQLAFEELDQPCERPYGCKELKSKYYGDMEVQGSKMYKNFKSKKKV
jgi:dCTP deaminase